LRLARARHNDPKVKMKVREGSFSSSFSSQSRKPSTKESRLLPT